MLPSVYKYRAVPKGLSNNRTRALVLSINKNIVVKVWRFPKKHSLISSDERMDSIYRAAGYEVDTLFDRGNRIPGPIYMPHPYEIEGYEMR